MGKGSRKQPKATQEPRTGKNPRTSPCTAQIAASADGFTISWHLGTLDREGPFGWGSIDADTAWDQVHSQLSSLESMTWSQLGQQGSHAVSLSELCKPARKRLAELQQDDVDQLYSLRVGGKPRVWGIRARHVLKVLWWDPHHEICPSQKKHT